MTNTTGHVVCLFVKSPRLGCVKTRLEPTIGSARCLDLHKAMAYDLTDRLGHDSTFDLTIFHTPDTDASEMRRWLGNDLIYYPQIGDNLGQRMQHALDQMLSAGYDKAAVIGSDIPELDADVVREAFRHLDRCDVVLGPTPDGGYYLIGLKDAYPVLFTNIPWSTDRVLEITMKEVRRARLQFALLTEISDVDTPDDLSALWNRCCRSEKSASVLLRTAGILQSIFSEQVEG